MNKNTKDLIYEKKASEASKNAIFFWYLIGIIYILLNTSVTLLSTGGAIFILIGMFLASIASAPLFILKNFIALQIIEKKQNSLEILIPLISCLEFIEIIAAPIIFIHFFM